MFLARKNVIVQSVLIEVEHHGTDLHSPCFSSR